MTFSWGAPECVGTGMGRSASYRVASGGEIVGSGSNRTRTSWNTTVHRVELNSAFKSKAVHCTIMDDVHERFPSNIDKQPQLKVHDGRCQDISLTKTY